MKSGNNNDKHLIELLKDMPKVNDSRDKNKLFQRISIRMENEQPKKRRKLHFLPIFSTLIAVAIILVIIPALLNNDMFQTHEELSSRNNADSGSTGEESSIKMDGQKDATLPDNGNTEMSLFSTAPKSFVLNDSKGKTIIRAAVADQQGQYIVPLSFVMAKTNDVTDSYNQLEKYIHAHEWGVAKYLFQNVSFKFDKTNGVVYMHLPEGFSLKQGSTSANMFEGILSTMFGEQQIDKVVFETANNQGITLGTFGTISELPIKPVNNTSYKLYQASEDKRKFLIPIPQDHNEIDDALNEMKQDEEAFNVYHTIPKDVDFTIDTTDNQLTLTFSKDKTLMDASMSVQENIKMIEAILMTAKSFGYDSVRFMNAGIDQIGTYNLMEAVKVPLAVNPISIEP